MIGRGGFSGFNVGFRFHDKSLYKGDIFAMKSCNVILAFIAVKLGDFYCTAVENSNNVFDRLIYKNSDGNYPAVQ